MGNLCSKGKYTYKGKPEEKFPFNVFHVEVKPGVKLIHPKAFSHCTCLTSVIIPNSVRSIGPSAFSYCTALTSLLIPPSVTTIGLFAFSDCTSLTSIHIQLPHEQWTITIQMYAFRNCISLKSINIPYSVTKIEMGTFCNCSSLEFVNIPPTVKSIGENAFVGCTNLYRVKIPSSVEFISESAFPDHTQIEMMETSASSSPPSVDTFKDNPQAMQSSSPPIKIGDEVILGGELSESVRTGLSFTDPTELDHSSSNNNRNSLYSVDTHQNKQELVGNEKDDSHNDKHYVEGVNHTNNMQEEEANYHNVKTISHSNRDDVDGDDVDGDDGVLLGYPNSPTSVTSLSRLEKSVSTKAALVDDSGSGGSMSEGSPYEML